jgi:hypothetical protein
MIEGLGRHECKCSLNHENLKKPAKQPFGENPRFLEKISAPKVIEFRPFAVDAGSNFGAI